MIETTATPITKDLLITVGHFTFTVARGYRRQYERTYRLHRLTDASLARLSCLLNSGAVDRDVVLDKDMGATVYFYSFTVVR